MLNLWIGWENNRVGYDSLLMWKVGTKGIIFHYLNVATYNCIFICYRHLIIVFLYDFHGLGDKFITVFDVVHLFLTQLYQVRVWSYSYSSFGRLACYACGSPRFHADGMYSSLICFTLSISLAFLVFLALLYTKLIIYVGNKTFVNFILYIYIDIYSFSSY